MYTPLVKLTNQTIHMGRQRFGVMPKVRHSLMLFHLGVRECLVVFGIWIDCLAVCHQSGVEECKGVLGTLAHGIALCCAVLGALHHGITPWGRRCQKGYLLVFWYHYGTTTVALLKPSGLVPVLWAHLD